MKKIFLISILLICYAGLLSADPDITAEINGDVYAIGDLIKVKVQITNNPGFHSLFFDIGYNESILAFEDIQEGLLVQREVLEAKLLYAVSDENTSAVHGSHIVVSYALKGPGTETPETGELVTLQFRVVSPGTPQTAPIRGDLGNARSAGPPPAPTDTPSAGTVKGGRLRRPR